MDLSFSRPELADAAPLPAADIALLVAALSTHGGASVTAQAQAALDQPAEEDGAGEPLLAPESGTFNATMAARLAGWSNE